jgi:hypothetical protein
MKIAFDNSIHLGQFSIANEPARIAAKNSQAMISTKPGGEVIGVQAFNENSYSDHIVWGLERDPQDRFYRFMDVFHSVKNIIRVPLNADDAQRALLIHRKHNLHMSNALTCAVAIAQQAQEIHSLYDEFRRPEVVSYLQQDFGITVTLPSSEDEQRFSEELERYYRDALVTFRSARVDLSAQFHR